MMIPTSRLPNESAKAYSAFRVYAEMDEKKRCHAAITKKCKIGIHLARKWSRLHKWKDRVRTWQLEAHERAAEADLAAKTALATERERRKAEVEEASWQMFLELSAKAREMLAFPLQTETTGPDGTIVIAPARWSLGDAARMMQVADSLARMGLGMPVNRSEITGKNGTPLNPIAAPVIEIRYLSDEASEKLIQEARPRLLEEQDR